MMDVIFGKIGSFSPNQKSGVCIIEMVAGRIGRKPFKGISVALHHHFWRQKGDPPQWGIITFLLFIFFHPCNNNIIILDINTFSWRGK